MQIAVALACAVHTQHFRPHDAGGGVLRSALLEELVWSGGALTPALALDLLAPTRALREQLLEALLADAACHSAAAHRVCAAVVLKLGATDINVTSTTDRRRRQI